MQTKAFNNEVAKIPIIAAGFPSIIRIGIFGSYARGDNTPDSDIDILYDYNDGEIDDTIKCLAKIKQSINADVDFLACENLADARDEYDIGFRDRVLNDVVWVYEKKSFG